MNENFFLSKKDSDKYMEEIESAKKELAGKKIVFDIDLFNKKRV